MDNQPGSAVSQIEFLGFIARATEKFIIVTNPEGEKMLLERTCVSRQVEIDLAAKNIVDQVRMDPVIAIQLFFEGVITPEQLWAARKGSSKNNMPSLVLDKVYLLGCPFKVKITPAVKYLQ